MRPDHYTNTEADAGRYEADYGADADWAPDVPDLADVYEHPTATLRRQREAHEARLQRAAARAAGDQTPSRLARMNSLFLAYPMHQTGTWGRLTPVRETSTLSPDGRYVQYATVYRLDDLDGDPGAAAEALTTGTLQTPNPEKYHRDAVIRDGVVWLMVHAQTSVEVFD